MFDNILPWEKSIYIDMLVQKVEEENEKARLEQSARRAAMKRK